MVQKNAFVREEGLLIRIDNNDIFFSGVLVINQKLKFAPGFPDGMHLSHVMTALPALQAFKDHGLKTILLPDTLPDSEPEFKSDKDNDYPLEEV